MLQSLYDAIHAVAVTGAGATSLVHEAKVDIVTVPNLSEHHALLLRSAGVEPGSVRFAFRPLWQLSASEKAGVALQKAQTTAVYAGLNLWPAATTAALVRSQLLEDGVYPGAAEALAAEPSSPTGLTRAQSGVADFDPGQSRDPDGRWSGGGGAASRSAPSAAAATPAPARAPFMGASSGAQARTLSSGIGGILNLINPVASASAQETGPEEERTPEAESRVSGAGEGDLRSTELETRYTAATQSLAEIAPRDPALGRLSAPGAPITETEVTAVETALRQAVSQRTCDFVRPEGKWIGERGTGRNIRVLPGGGLVAAERDFDYLTVGATRSSPKEGTTVARFPGDAGEIAFRENTSSPGSPAIDFNIGGIHKFKLHY